MRNLLIILTMSAISFGQAPVEDSRNTYLPNTDTHFKAREYKTLQEWEARKAHLRKQILSAAGLMPMPEKTPLHPQIFGRTEHGDYSVEKVLLETMPGFYVGGNLYRPLNKTGKFPAVMTAHGHWLYGRLENQGLASIPGRSINLARQGYVVFSYDMVGYNDTIQTPHRFAGPRYQLWSFGALALQLWDSIRVVDFLQSLPDVDAERIAMTGASGGGTQTFLLTAIDDRVKYSAPVNMISAIMQGGCVCENAPNMRLDTSNLDIGAMMAPRPMLMVAATGDWTKNTPAEEYPAVRRIYELYGKGENLETVQFQADHNYNKQSREAVYKFFAKHILGDSNKEKYSERNFEVDLPNNLLALHNRTLPANALTFEGVFDQWKQTARAQTAATRDPEAIRERLMYSLGAEWPAAVLSEADGERVVLSRAGRGDRVSGIWIAGKGLPALVVHPDGAEAARKSPAVQELIREKRAVLLIDAFQTGPAVAPRDRSHDHFLTFNRSDDANRVQDILTALKFVGTKQPGKIEVIGLGKAGPWAVFAAAVAPAELKLKADLSGFDGSDQDFLDRFFVPGIQKAGGLDAALLLTEGMRK
jgi:dienelactone hydrolase